MLAAMRRASLCVSSMASGGFLPRSRLIVLSITGHLVICRTDDKSSSIERESNAGLFLLRERQRACSSRHAAGAALLLLVTLLPGCSDVALADEMPASEPDPGYNNLVAKHLKDTFKNRASYDAFAISAFRWVHSFKGWAWMTCVRFEDNGHPRTYAVFIKDGKVIDSRYAVQTDACNTQTYAVFDAMGPTRTGVLGPLY
jgi:hypothetical protein